MRIRYAVPCAGLLAMAGAHCATSGKASESPSPATRQVASSQQASEEALKNAAGAQKQANEQNDRAAEAQARVRQDQEKLRQDQEISQAETVKAQQAQQQARQATQAANRQTAQQQQRAASGLSQQTRAAARGQQLAAGVVTQVRPDEVTVQPPSGQPMRFRVDDGTEVRIDGRRSTAERIQEGQQARVAYEASSDGPTAVSIRVTRAGTGTGGANSAAQPGSAGSGAPQ